MKRQAKLEEIGLDSEEAAATVGEFESVDEETFDKIVAVMKKKGKKENPFDKTRTLSTKFTFVIKLLF